MWRREKKLAFCRFVAFLALGASTCTSTTTSYTRTVLCASRMAVRTACGWGYGYGLWRPGPRTLVRALTHCVSLRGTEATFEKCHRETMFLSIPGVSDPCSPEAASPASHVCTCFCIRTARFQVGTFGAEQM